MYTPSQTELDFLFALYQQTAGDQHAQASMYEVGAALGLDKTGASAISQDLMIEELIELKSLSGGIALMEGGVACLQKSGMVQGGAAPARLSTERFVTGEDRENIAALLTEIKSTIATAGQPYARLEELVVDIKTLEVQLLSPRPCTAIVRETFGAVAERLGTASTDLTKTIASFIDN